MKPLAIALTGGIGSGKSTIADYFKALGATIISADSIAKELTATNTEAYREIVAHFGKHILHADKSINRQALRQIIFNNPDERIWLEKLLHPRIEQDISQRVAKLESGYCLIEIPLLKPNHSYHYISRVLLVTATTEQKIKRIIKRDNIHEEKALSIIKQQLTDSERLSFADDVIENNGSKDDLKQQVLKLHQQYLNTLP